MKITLEIPDGTVAAFMGSVERAATGYKLVSYQLGSDELKDGSFVRLPPTGGTKDD